MKSGIWVCAATVAAVSWVQAAAPNRTETATPEWLSASIPWDALAAGITGRVSPQAASAHATITEYLGPETCVACHRTEAEAMHGSVHYQQTGPTPNVPNIPGFAGERGFGDIGFNTYCGTHVSSSRATCATCHVGNGQYPSPVMSDAQLNNIDCLMCHQDAYKRKPAGPFKTVPVVGQDGQPATSPPTSSTAPPRRASGRPSAARSPGQNCSCPARPRSRATSRRPSSSP